MYPIHNLEKFQAELLANNSIGNKSLNSNSLESLFLKILGSERISKRINKTMKKNFNYFARLFSR